MKASERGALMEAGEILARIYIEENINRLVPMSFPDERDHVMNILSSALQTKYNYGYGGGSLVKNLVANKLYESFSSSDSVIQKHLCILAAGIEHISFKEIKEKADKIWKDNNPK